MSTYDAFGNYGLFTIVIGLAMLLASLRASWR
jgi:hypothetical protein